MIDNKKIEDAAKSLRKDFNDDVTQGFLVEFGFEKGAKWAIDEFLKDLWHPANEKPKDNKALFVQYHQLGRKDPWYITLNLCKITNWRDTVADFLIKRWCYIDDLLPKKGGKK